MANRLKIIPGSPGTRKASEPVSPHRRNYFWNLVAGAAMLASMVTASINLVLPWLLSTLGAGHAVAVLIIPFARIGELASNLLLARPIGHMPLAKRAAFLSLMCSGILVALLAPTLFTKSLALATIIFMVVAIGIGVAHGANNLALQVIIAKTVKSEQQGNLLSIREMLAGLVALSVYLLHVGAQGAPGDHAGNAARLGIAAALMFLAALSVMLVREEPTCGSQRKSGAKLPWHLLRYSPMIRRYILLRIFARPTYLLVPFLVLHISGIVSHKHALSVFVFASIMGTIAGSAVASRLADRRLPFIVLAGPLIGCATVAYVLALDEYKRPQELFMYAGAFLTASMACKFLGIGLDTFLIKALQKEQVAPVTGMSRFIVVGVTIAFAASLGILAQSLNTWASLGVMAGLQIICLGLGWRSLADIPTADGSRRQRMPSDDSEIRFGPAGAPSLTDTPWLNKALLVRGLDTAGGNHQLLRGGCHSHVMRVKPRQAGRGEAVIKWISGDAGMTRRSWLMLLLRLQHLQNKRVQLLQSFMDEASFYLNTAQGTAGLRVPRSLWVHSDPWRQRFAVVMEPVPATARETGEPDGFNASLARVCLRRLAIFHASHWSEAGRRQGAGFWRGAMMWEAKSRFPECWVGAMLGLGLDQRYESLGRRLGPHLEKIRKAVKAIPVRTMIHGDFKVTNVFVEPDRADAQGEVWAIDWQWYGAGNPAADSVFFLLTSLRADLLTTTTVREMLRLEYHAILIREGITEYDFETMWTEWMWFAVDFLLYTVSCKWHGMTHAEVLANRAGGRDGLHLRSPQQIMQIITLIWEILANLGFPEPENPSPWDIEPAGLSNRTGCADHRNVFRTAQDDVA